RTIAARDSNIATSVPGSYPNPREAPLPLFRDGIREAFLHLEPERELDRARPTDLVEGVQAAAAAAGAEAGREGLRRAAEEGAAEVAVRRAEVRVVQDVEKLRPEREPHLLAEMEPTLRREVELRSAEPAQHVAPEVPLLPSGRRRKCGPVEDLRA